MASTMSEKVQSVHAASKKPAQATIEGASGSKPEQTAPSGILAQLFGTLDAAHAAAQAAVERARAHLAEVSATAQAAVDAAVKELAVTDALVNLRNHGGDISQLSTSQTPRKPARKSSGVGAGNAAGRARGAMSERVLALISDAALPAGTILDRLQCADVKEKQSVRNFLASGKKSGALKYDEKTKAYKKA